MLDCGLGCQTWCRTPGLHTLYQSCKNFVCEHIWASFLGFISVFHFLSVWLFLFSILLHYNKINVFFFLFIPLVPWLAHLGFSSSSSVHECFPLWYLFSLIFLAKFPFLSDVYLHCLYLPFPNPPHFSQYPCFLISLHSPHFVNLSISS